MIPFGLSPSSIGSGQDQQQTTFSFGSLFHALSLSLSPSPLHCHCQPLYEAESAKWRQMRSQTAFDFPSLGLRNADASQFIRQAKIDQVYVMHTRASSFDVQRGKAVRLGSEERQARLIHFRAGGLLIAAHWSDIYASYESLLNSLSCLNQSQRVLEARIRDVRLQSMIVGWGICIVSRECLGRINGHDQLLGRVFVNLYGKFERVESKAARMENKRGEMEGIIAGVDEKMENLDAEITGQLDELAEMKKEIRSMNNFVICCGLGGILVIVGIILFK